MQKRSAAEVVRLAADEGVEIVDLRFCDLPGLMQHFSVPVMRSPRTRSTKGTGSTGPRSEGSRRSKSRT